MFQRHHDIYASGPMRRLLDAQMRGMAADLQHCHGTHALLVDALPDQASPALPALGHWTHLRAVDTDYVGAVRASMQEPLPFVDDAFELVLLRHAVEIVPDVAALLTEIARVLVPGGLLVVTGLHPISGWALWFRWNARGRGRVLRTPLFLCHVLGQAGVDIERTQRIGQPWPGSVRNVDGNASLFGGGYLLIARKRRRAVSPLRAKIVPIRVPAGGRLSPGTRRSSAS